MNIPSLSDIRSKKISYERVVLGIAVGIVPVILAAPTLLEPGYPFGGEIYSNLVPVTHARQAIAAGEFPWHAPWFSGRNIWLNPLFKGAYPFAWPMFMPFIPLTLAIKFVVALHLFGATIIAFEIINKDVKAVPAAAMSLLFVSPIAVQVGVAHIEKLFAWPWLVLAATQVVPWRLQKAPKQAGKIIGICIGMALLAGGHYYAFYIGLLLLVGILALAWKAWPFVKQSVGWAGIVGLPHIMMVTAVVVGGTDRPPVHYKSTLSDVLAALSGLHYTPLATLQWLTQSYAVIGLPAMLVGAYGWYRANYKGKNFNHRWSLAVLTVGGCSILLASGNRLLYLLPGIDTFRVASRITVLISVLILLTAWYALREPRNYSESDKKITNHTLFHTTLILLLISSAIIGSVGMMYHIGGAGSSYPQDSEQVATTVSELGCQSAWIMSTPVLDSAEGVPVSSPELGFSLAQEGITVRAMHYGSIGQEWVPTAANGTPTFDVLLTGGPLPQQESIPLSVSDHPFEVGEVQREIFAEPVRVSTTTGTVWIYPVRDGCES